MEDMRSRIQQGAILDAYNEIMARLAMAGMGLDGPTPADPHRVPMTKREIEAAKTFCIAAAKILAKVMPDLKQIEFKEHTPQRQLTREQMIGRLTALHARATAQPDGSRTAGSDGADGKAPLDI